MASPLRMVTGAAPQVLLRPVELGLRNADGSTIRLSLCSTLGPAALVAEDPTCEHNEGLVACVEVAVPASRGVDRPAQRLREFAHDLLIYLELDESPGKGLAGAHVTDIPPADLANPEVEALKGVVLRDALRNQGTECTHVGIVVAGCLEGITWTERRLAGARASGHRSSADPKRPPSGRTGHAGIWLGQNRWHASRHRPSLRLGRGRYRLDGPRGRGPSENRVDRTRCADSTDPPRRRPTPPPPHGGASRRRWSCGVGGGRPSVGRPGNLGGTGRPFERVDRTDRLDVASRLAGRFP